MTLILMSDTETRLRTVAKGRGLDPQQFHEYLLQRALAEAETEKEALPLHTMSLDDPPTHLLGRNTFQMQLLRQWQESSRTNAPLTLLLLDIDNFKQINDAVGHVNGDLLLKEIAATLIRKTRAQDFVARLGGDEFVIILPDTNAMGAEHIVRAIRAVMIDHFSDKGQPVTMSTGLAEAPPFEGTANDLLSRADQALFAEKQQQRGDLKRAVVPAVPEPAVSEPTALEPEVEKAEAQKQRVRRNLRLIARLDSFEAGDLQRQKQDLKALQAGLEEARPGQRRLFGEGVNS